MQRNSAEQAEGLSPSFPATTEGMIPFHKVVAMLWPCVGNVMATLGECVGDVLAMAMPLPWHCLRMGFTCTCHVHAIWPWRGIAIATRWHCLWLLCGHALAMCLRYDGHVLFGHDMAMTITLPSHWQHIACHIAIALPSHGHHVCQDIDMRLPCHVSMTCQCCGNVMAM